MPFQSDSSCGTFNMELNTTTICEYLENILEKEITVNVPNVGITTLGFM